MPLSTPDLLTAMTTRPLDARSSVAVVAKGFGIEIDRRAKRPMHMHAMHAMHTHRHPPAHAHDRTG